MSTEINIARLTGKSSLLKQGKPEFCWICGKRLRVDRVYEVYVSNIVDCIMFIRIALKRELKLEG